jgi:FHA domain-containing protein
LRALAPEASVSAIPPLAPNCGNVSRHVTGHNRLVGVAKSIEERLEGLVEGFFSKVFRSGLQPVEVGRRILKTMAENPTVSVNRTYVPNVFDVYMSEDDIKRFEQMSGGLETEFSELVVEQAKQNRWSLMGLPKIKFQVDADYARGDFRVDATLESDPAAIAEQAGKPSRKKGAQLVLISESGDPTERFPLETEPAVIGRLSSCDIYLSDHNVSRRHAELRSEGGTWSISDLGSTNGTEVNGSVVGEAELKDGDLIVVGSTTLRFQAG